MMIVETMFEPPEVLTTVAKMRNIEFLRKLFIVLCCLKPLSMACWAYNRANTSVDYITDMGGSRRLSKPTATLGSAWHSGP